MAQADDAVLVLGKGHEQGQEAAGVVTPFDDRVELRRGAGGVGMIRMDIAAVAGPSAGRSSTARIRRSP